MSGLTAAQQLMAALRIDDSTSEVPSRRHPPLHCEPRLGPRRARAPRPRLSALGTSTQQQHTSSTRGRAVREHVSIRARAGRV